jgi:hypothetical protein
MPDGKFAIVCTRGQKKKPCVVCGRPGEVLCDYPLSGAKTGAGQRPTCDRLICRRCAVRIRPDVDYCPTHARLKGLI